MPLSARRVHKQFKHAMYFDGVDDYVSIAEPSYVAGSRKLTIVAWVNPLEPYTDSWDVVSEGWDDDWAIMYSWEHLYGRLLFTDGTYVILDLGWHGYTPNTWGYVVFGWDIDAGIVFGFNGWLNYKATASVNPSKTPRNIADVIIIGSCDCPLNGYIAQVLVYSRALSDSEIQQNYNCPDNPVRNGLVLWLKADPQYVKDIDGDGRLELLDLSGNGNHGKIYGATLVQLIKSASRVVQAQRVLPVVSI